MLPIKTILHATDFSPQASYAFHLAVALAHDYHARLAVVHVQSPPEIYVGDYPMALPPDPSVITEALRRQLDDLRAPSDVAIERHLREGFAPEEIVRLASECEADVIVLGTHGRSGVGRLLMGSVAEAVLRKASCPVLTVKMPAEQKPATRGVNSRLEPVGG